MVKRSQWSSSLKPLEGAQGGRERQDSNHLDRLVHCGEVVQRSGVRVPALHLVCAMRTINEANGRRLEQVFFAASARRYSDMVWRGSGCGDMPRIVPCSDAISSETVLERSLLQCLSCLCYLALSVARVTLQDATHCVRHAESCVRICVCPRDSIGGQSGMRRNAFLERVLGHGVLLGHRERPISLFVCVFNLNLRFPLRRSRKKREPPPPLFSTTP